MSCESSIVARILLGTVPRHAKAGRVVRFDMAEPDIALTTGPMPERILNCLKSSPDPMTIREVATAIASNPSRVTVAMNALVKAESVMSIKIDGSVTEYTLREDA